LFYFNSYLYMTETRTLTKEQAEKIAQITSSVYEQGSTWVLTEWNLKDGTEKLVRGLTSKSAKKRLHNLRKEKVENLLREERKAAAYTIRIWRENCTWGGEGFWHWADNFWYTTEDRAKESMEEQALKGGKYEVYEIRTEEVPGHFRVI
jgi:hypothetical protein